MPEYLDLERWNRRKQYDFFLQYEQPFFNICAPLDVTELRAHCREQRLSFFLASLYLSARAVNQVLPFRYRLRDEGVVVHPRIHTGSTVLLEDETFTFAYFDDHDAFADFYPQAKHTVARIHAGDAFDPQDERDDLIHYSVVPWMSFTSFSHARRHVVNDSVPKIVFGRYAESEGRLMMPVSVEVHHALMDGLHVGRYFEVFGRLLSGCGDLLVV